MRKRTHRWQTAAALMPALFLAAVITAGVAVNTMMEGMGWLPELEMREIHPGRFGTLLSDPAFQRGMVFTLRTAAISTLLSVSAGTAMAGVTALRPGRGRGGFLLLPVILSYMASAVMIYNTFSRNGLIYHIAQWAGIHWEGPDIVFSPSGAAVILLYVFKGAPYIAMSLIPVFRKAAENWLGAAVNLGAGRLTAFTRVILPAGKRTMLTGALVLFNFDLAAYEGFAYLGSTRPTAPGVLALQLYRRADLRYRADAMAVNAVLIGIALISAAVFSRTLRKEAGIR